MPSMPAAAGPPVHDEVKVIRHAKMQKDADKWLGKIAEPDERERTQRLLQSLVAATQHGSQEQQPAPTTSKHTGAKPSGTRLTMSAKGGHGWSYTATSSAIRRTTQPFPAGGTTSSSEGAYSRGGPHLSVAGGRAISQQPYPGGAGVNVHDGAGAAAAPGGLDDAALEEELAAMMAALPGGRGIPPGLVGGRPRSAPNNRELRTLMAAAAARAGASAATAALNADLRRTAGKTEIPPAGGNTSNRPTTAKSGATGSGSKVEPEVTSYQMAFHLAKFYPELYAAAVAGTQSEPVPNYTLISDWGDSLKAGEDAEWRKKFFKSLYTATNEDVHSALEASGASADAAKERAFYRWMAKQQTYYRELLTAGARPEVDALLSGVPIDRKRAALEVLRQLVAVTRPEMLVSHSQATHHHMVRAEDPELTELIKEQTRVRTMGRPPPRVEGTYQTIAQKMAGKTVGEGELIAALRAATGGAEGGVHAGRPATAPLVVGPRKVEISPFGGNAAGSGGGVRGGPGRPPSRAGFQGGPGGWAAANGGVAGDSAAAPGLRPLTALASRQAAALGGGGGGVRPSSASAALGGAWAVPGAGGLNSLSATSLSEPEAGPSAPHNACIHTNAVVPVRPKLKGPPVKDEKETFKSKLPIKWAVAGNGPTISSYVDAYGSPGLSGGQASSLARHNLTQPAKYKEVTCPIGAVNKHTALAPERAIYPVPQAYVSGPPTFPMGPGDVTMETLHRSSYAPRDAEDVKRSLVAAAEQTTFAHTMAQKSTLPLGKNALGMLPSKNWVSDYDDNFVAHRLDVAGDYARAQGLKAYLSGPTASAGRLTARARQPSAPTMTLKERAAAMRAAEGAAAAGVPRAGPGPVLVAVPSS